MALGHIVSSDNTGESWFEIMAPEDSVVWVNAYEVSRHWGGAEEGGWWYDAGIVLASIPCFDDQQVEIAINTLKRLYLKEYEGRRTRFSAIGEEDLDICVEDKKATEWPEETPHYE